MWDECFVDRVVIVGGGSTGIGAASVAGFARAGARVVVTDVADGPGGDLASALRAEGCDVVYRHCDVANEADVVSTFEASTSMTLFTSSSDRSAWFWGANTVTATEASCR